jgi:replicative DNA helicase
MSEIETPPSVDEPPEREDTALPYSLEAEQSVIGGLMRDAENFESVAEVLADVDFYRREHRLIFSAMSHLVEKNQPIDVITVSEHLSQREELEDVGGLDYLTDLATNVPSTENVAAYARIVRENATFRQIISTSTEITRASFNPGGLSSDDLIQLAEKRFLEVAEGRPNEGGFVYVNELLKSSLEKIDERNKNQSDITGLSTGLDDLNEKTSGWQPGELIILAARPSMGKTALALNFVEAALMTQDKPVVIFSLEMPADSLVMRMMSSLGRIDQGGMRSGRMQEDDWPKLDLAVRKLKDKKLFIDDTPGLNPTEMKARLRRLEREHGAPALVMVDYIQLMSLAGFSEGRTQEVSEISRAMKALARDYSCPVICLSQLNRGVEQRPNKRPMNSDLRESGAIEQDADVILFIYRDEYYNEDSPDKGVAELIVGKQRNGETGTVRAAWVGKYTRFDNLAFDAFGGDSGAH